MTSCLMLVAFISGQADRPLPAEVAARNLVVPKGMKATLFASEPMVSQPMALTTDSKGRVWVIENFSYPKWITNGAGGKDRIVILEDTDGDGRADKRTVFAEGLVNASGIALGAGGVWLAATPNLSFIPDADGDDKPDGPPEVVLDGWDLKAKHNVVSSLKFGPDGWLWGCNGILGNASIGVPGAPQDKRVKFNCGVWRLDPKGRVFEVVAHGTTNPWGLDFDQNGEAFISNCVIAHLWHAVPGARFERMFGSDPNPHAYQLMKTIADHLHWGGGHWTSSRGGQGVHSVAGGGHAHAGLAIARHPDLPAEINGCALMANIHGKRVNSDFLQPNGSSFKATHRPDPIVSDDPWFRGLIVTQGPDASLFVTDWNDTGECHNYEVTDGVTGRIYRVAPEVVGNKGIRPASLPSVRLPELLSCGDAWLEEQARLTLRARFERDGLGADRGSVLALLEKSAVAENMPGRSRLAAMWGLAVAGGIPAKVLDKAVTDPDEAVRGWACRLGLASRASAWIARARRGEPSARVRLAMISASIQLPPAERFDFLEPLSRVMEDAGDPMIPLLLWYRLEPLLAESAAARERLLSGPCLLPIARFLARRISGSAEGDEWLAKAAAGDSGVHPSHSAPLLAGWADGLSGKPSPGAPAGWIKAQASMAKRPEPEIRLAGMSLSQVFGSPDVSAALVAMASDESMPIEVRSGAINAWAVRPRGDLRFLLAYLANEELAGPALSAMAAGSDVSLAGELVRAYPKSGPRARQSILAALAGRKAWAAELVGAMEKGAIDHREVPAHLARQVAEFKDPQLKNRLEKAWGSVQPISGDRKAMVEKWRVQLSAGEIAKGDAKRGRALFTRNCAACHRMFGEGGNLGPDLTGGQRGELRYWLENIIDPSAVVGREHQRTVVETKDGRVVAGVVAAESASHLILRSAEGESRIAQGNIESRVATGKSIMPDGLLDGLKPGEPADLLAFLMSGLAK